MSSDPTTLGRKFMWISGSLMLLFAAFVLYRKIPGRAGSAENFFERNAALTRPAARIDERTMPVRISDEFLSADFHLKPGQAYPVQIKSETSFRGGDGHNGKVDYGGIITFHSVSWSGHRLLLIAEFKISNFTPKEKISAAMKSEIGLSGSVKQDANLYLLELDPAGKIESIASSLEKLDEGANSLKIQAVSMILRRLPELQKGEYTKTEPDLSGHGFPIHYLITDAPGNNLKIAGDVKLEDEMGKTSAKSAVAGAPVLAQVSLQNKQEQSFEWIWSVSNGRPVHQDFRAKASMVSYGREFGAYLAELTTDWKGELKSRFTASDLKRFRFRIPFQQFLNSQDQGKKKLASKEGAGMSWSEIQSNLVKLHADKLSDKQKDQLFSNMAQAVQQNPSLVGPVAQIGLNGDPGSAEVSMALGALGYEGSPVSQAAMISIFNRKESAEVDRQKVMTEFALCNQPLSPETKLFLRDQFKKDDPMSSHLANGAGLALGSSIAHDGDPQTVNLIKSEWSSSSGIISDNRQAENSKIYLLAVMGNSKSDAFISEVKTASNSNRSEVRAAAADAVRFAQDDESRNLLLNSLQNDSDAEVRIAAAHAMRYQPFDEKTSQALQSCSTASYNVGVKLECYRALSVNLGQPGVREWLQSRSSAESDPQIKTFLKDALAELNNN